MESNGKPHSSPRDTYLTIVLCIMVGIPAFVFLNILTGGLFVLLLVMAAGVGVLAAVNYFLWGRSFNREVAGEREEEELRERAEAEEGPYDEPHGHRRF